MAMAIMNVTAPIERMKELILREYPNYYKLNHIKEMGYYSTVCKAHRCKSYV